MTKILVVDDSPTELALITLPLKKEGFDVISAVDGEEGLIKIDSEKPDLVILDVILPRKNGFQICRQIKTQPETKNIPVILLTSRSQDSDKFWGMKQGADEYMTKPFNSEELLAAIKRFIN